MQKNKIITPRNAVARDLLTNGLYRSKKEKSTAEKTAQKDAYNRKAKHKGKEIIDVQLGDDISYRGKEGIVKNPNGPAGLVGISIDGEYDLVPADDLKIINEALSRMRDLSRD